MPNNTEQRPVPLLTAATCAAVGIFFSDRFPPDPPAFIGVLAATAVYLGCAKERHALLIATCVLYGALHHWQHNIPFSRQIPERLRLEKTLAVTLEGQVLDVPQTEEMRTLTEHSRFLLGVENATPEDLALRNSSVLVRWLGTPPQYGAKVRLRAALRAIPRARNPGQPDFYDYWNRRNTWLEAEMYHPEDGAFMKRASFFSPSQWSHDLQDMISNQLLRGIEDRPETHALITSMVLGSNRNLLGGIRPNFRDTGTLHLFAVSGLNLSMLAGMLAVLLRLAGCSPKTVALITAPVLLLYAFATGLGPSCARAFLMAALFLFGNLVCKPSVPLNNLGAAALVLLVADTNYLFSASFQLSFGLVAALLAAQPMLRHISAVPAVFALTPRHLWSARKQSLLWLYRQTVSALVLGVVAWSASLPFNIVLFHQITPIALFANFAAIPIAFLNLALGFTSLICAPLGNTTPLINQLNALVAESLLRFVGWCAKVPHGHWLTGAFFQRTPNLLVFDVGDGGALFLRSEKHLWMFDSGSEKDAKSTVLPGLLSNACKRLDGLALTHADQAHIGGAIALQHDFNPERIVESSMKSNSKVWKNLHQTLEGQGIKIQSSFHGDILQKTGSLLCEVLYPPPDLRASVSDDKCLVVRWSTPNWSVLYTADAGFPTERWLLENARHKLRADLWIRGAHVHDETGSIDFCRAVSPKLIVVASSSRSKHLETLLQWKETIQGAGIPVWLQEECGAVEGWEGSVCRVRGFLNGAELAWPSGKSRPGSNP